MARWLLKTEPGEYAYADLVRERRTAWEGVRNALAQRHLRRMAKGDEVLVYHTGKERAAVGIARVVHGPYDDAAGAAVVDLAPVRALPRPVPLAEMKAEPALAGFDLFRLGRLSVVPVTAPQWQAIMRLAERPAD